MKEDPLPTNVTIDQGNLIRGVRRVKEGTSAGLKQSGLDEKWWEDSIQCYDLVCETSQMYHLFSGRRPMTDVLRKPFNGPIIPFGSLVQYQAITANDQSRIHQFETRKFYLDRSSDTLFAPGEPGRVTYQPQTLQELETTDASEIYRKRLRVRKS